MIAYGCRRTALVLGTAALFSAPIAAGQVGLEPSRGPSEPPRDIVAPTLTLAANYTQDGTASSAPSGKTATAKQPDSAPKPDAHEAPQGSGPFGLELYHYREISSFFNIREANANLEQGEWEYETTFEWATHSKEHDELILEPSLKYGFTNDVWVELNAPFKLGEGGDQGNGDLGLEVFWQFLHETDAIPAMATWAEFRIPSGQGSSGVDGTLHMNVTKTIVPQFRAHLEGFIETANGYRGGDEDLDRRNFQWGVGPGFDYLFSDKTIGVINYLNRCSEEFGHHNQNILEIGVAHEIVKGQHLKLAADIGLDGAEESPNFAVKLQWSIEWK